MLAKALLAISALSTIVIAAPTPASLAARSCTTLVPDILQVFSESDPSTIYPNTADIDGSFFVSTDAGQTNRVYQGVAFTGLPPVTQGPCTLAFTFAADADIEQWGQVQLNVSTIAKGNSAAIVADTYSYDDISTDGAVDVGLLGTVGPFSPGQTVVVNAESCPTDLNGGGSLAFLFSIASWVDGAASVSFAESADLELTGVYLTYGC